MKTKNFSILDILHCETFNKESSEEKLNIERRKSFHGKELNIDNSFPVLNRTNGKLDIRSISNIKEKNNSDFFHSKFKFEKIDTIKNLDAKNYIYLGSAEKSIKSTHGISLDEHGNLVIIKGRCYNLVRGFIKEKTSGHKYEKANIILKNEKKEIYFESLFLNENGKLVGQEKGSNKLHEITIQLQPKEFDFNIKDNEVKDNILIELNEYKDSNIDQVSFQLENNKHISFFIKDKCLYSNELQQISDNKCKLTNQHVKLPLGNDIKILSVKKTKNMMQLETDNKGKKRIYYLDPQHMFVTKKGIHVSKLSHKPPQGLITKLGNDPHEYVYSGQPFSDNRYGNFSSNHLPLFSKPTDTFRINIKKAKNFYAQGKTKKALSHIPRAIDPGFEAIIKIGIKSFDSLKGKIKKSKSEKNQDSEKIQNLMESKKNIIKYQKRIDEIINHAIDSDSPKDFSSLFLELINHIDDNERISLGSMSKFSMFFGIAVGGYPFVKGWFAGIVASITKNKGLSIEKKPNGNIQFIFSNNLKKEAIGLIGTGQGTEEVWKLAHNGIDYLACLPAEANLILAAHANHSETFSFEITPDNLMEFLTSLEHPDKVKDIDKYIIENSTLTKVDDHNVLGMLEAKSEIRPEIGFMADANTYLVIPRTALGLRMAAYFWNFNRNKIVQISPIPDSDNENTSNDKKNKGRIKYKLEALKFEAGLFHEEKIMPIGLVFDNQNVWCFPMPLIEENGGVHKVLTNFSNKFFSTDYAFQKEWENKDKPLLLTCPEEIYNDMKIIEDYLSQFPDHKIEYKPIEHLNKVRINYLISSDKEKKTLKGVKINMIGNDDTFNKELNNIKTYFEDQKRKNLNKTSATWLECHYSLHASQQHKDIKSKINDFLSELNKHGHEEEYREELKNKSKEICEMIKSQSKNSQYDFKLDEIKIKRKSDAAEKTSSLPFAICSFQNEQHFSYDEIIGKISIQYEPECSIYEFPEKASIELRYLI